jgi:UDP-N-acetylmuramate--alanine ligase
MANALAAIAAVSACDVSPQSAVKALEQFAGVKRRLDVIGTKNGVTVIDDFAHNPDKIAATLATLRATPGRLLIFFQPHGYGPLRLMRQGFAGAFAEGMRPEDLLILPDPAYFGGTTDRSVTSADLVQDMAQMGVDARHLPTRDEAKAVLTGLLRPGDRVVVMGARDDTLTEFARDILASA